MLKDLLSSENPPAFDRLSGLKSEINQGMPESLGVSEILAKKVADRISLEPGWRLNLVGKYNQMINNPSSELFDQDWSLTPIFLPEAYQDYAQIQTQTYLSTALKFLPLVLGSEANPELQKTILDSLPPNQYPSFWKVIQAEWKSFQTNSNLFSFSGRNDTLAGKILEPNATAVGNMPEITIAEVISSSIMSEFSEFQDYPNKGMQNWSSLNLWRETIIQSGRRFRDLPRVSLMVLAKEMEKPDKQARFATLKKSLVEIGLEVGFSFLDKPQYNSRGNLITENGLSPDIFFKDVDIPRDLPAQWDKQLEEALISATREGRIVSPLLGDLFNTKSWLAGYGNQELLQQSGLDQATIDAAQTIFPWSRVVTPELDNYIRGNMKRLYLKPAYIAGGKGVVDVNLLEPNQLNNILNDASRFPGKWLAQEKLPYKFVSTVRASGDYNLQAFTIDVFYGFVNGQLLGVNLSSRANRYEEDKPIVTNTGAGGMYTPIFLYKKG